MKGRLRTVAMTGRASEIRAMRRRSELITGDEGVRARTWRVIPRMGEVPANSDRVIANIARRQHGVVSTEQLQRGGIGPNARTVRVKAGRLHRLHRGVYAVGHTSVSFEGRCMAAVLALGEGAAVSHRSAAAIWGMRPPHNGPIEVTVSGDGGREKRRGITVHRSSTLVADFRTRRNGIAVTRPKRTLRDLHRTSPQPVFEGAVRRALDLRLIARPISRGRKSSAAASWSVSSSASVAVTACPARR